MYTLTVKITRYSSKFAQSELFTYVYVLWRSWENVCTCLVERHTAVQVASTRERRHTRQSRCVPHLPEQD